MDIVTVLIVVLLVLALTSFPAWPHARGWGYSPFGLILVILLVLLLFRGHL